MFNKALKAIAAILYPKVCAACGGALQFYEKEICVDCLAEMPQTNLQKIPRNHLQNRLNEMFDCQNAAALLYMNKRHSAVREMIHSLKFYDERELAVTLGHQLGAKLMAEPHFAGLEAVVPVPLHCRRQARRGYNQAECFARGVAAEMGLPMVADAVSRIRKTNQQAKAKTHQERLENVRGAFELTEPQKLEPYSEILIVDDVVTTGATIAECAKAILEGKPKIRIAVGAIAIKEETNS